MRVYALVQAMIPQKSGKATPSVAGSLIERLPVDSDPQRLMEEKIAQNVLFAAYVGMWWWCACSILVPPPTLLLSGTRWRRYCEQKY